MTKPAFALRRSLEERRQFLQQHCPGRSKTMGEFVGGTTAEVAAVGCCLPITAINFSVLTMYKVPASLYRNARRQRRRLLMHRNGNGGGGGGGRECEVDDEMSMHPAVTAAVERFMVPEVDKEMVALEDEMWEEFSERGFWRGSSEI